MGAQYVGVRGISKLSNYNSYPMKNVGSGEVISFIASWWVICSICKNEFPNAQVFVYVSN